MPDRGRRRPRPRPAAPARAAGPRSRARRTCTARRWRRRSARPCRDGGRRPRRRRRSPAAPDTAPATSAASGGYGPCCAHDRSLAPRFDDVTGSISPPPPVADLSMPWDARGAGPGRGDRGGPGRARRHVRGPRRRAPSTSSCSRPAGVQSFYDVAEADASKGIADWQMLRRKLPDELFLDRRTFPHDLFARDDVAHVPRRRRAGDRRDVGRARDRRDRRRVRPHPPARPPHRPLDLGRAVRRPGPGLRAADRRPRRARRRGRVRGPGRDGRGRRERQGRRSTPRSRWPRPSSPTRSRSATRTRRRRPTTSSASSTRGRGSPDRVQGIARDVVLVHLGSMSNLFAALGLAARRRARPPRAPRGGPGRRRRAHRAVRDGVDPRRATVDHDARRRAAVRRRRRGPRVRGRAWRHARDAAPAHQLPGRVRPRGLRPRPVVTPPAARRPAARGTGAGDHVRPRRRTRARRSRSRSR